MEEKKNERLQECLRKLEFDKLLPWRLIAMETAELEEVFAIITDIANQRGRSDQPFGVDEFPSLDYFTEYAGSGYAVKMQEIKGKIGAYVFLTPSHFSRLPKPIYADLRVATVHPQPSVKLFFNILKLIQELAVILGYVGLVIDTFTCNVDAIQAATENGFRSALVVPLSAKLVGQGPCDSMILLKILRELSDFPQPGENPTDLLNARIRPRIVKSAANFIPQHLHLPGGNKVFVRNAVETDCQRVLHMMKQAASQGTGFGPWEVPSEEFIHGSSFGQGLTLESVVEGHQPQIIGHLFVEPSAFCRSAAPLLADCTAVVDHRIRSKGIGSLINSLFATVARESGYVGTLADTFVRNTPMVKINHRRRAVVVGSVCRGGFLRGQGYSDTIFFFRPLTDGNTSRQIGLTDLNTTAKL